jgi:hypothetical protein
MPADRLTRISLIDLGRSLTPIACLAVVLVGVVGSRAQSEDDLSARRATVATLSPAEQQELLQKQERFLALPLDEQDRLRTLQAAIDADPHGARYRQILSGYHEWLKTLTPTERAELSELPPEQRIKRIKDIQRHQQHERDHAQRVELLNSRDMRAILSWIEDLVWANRDKLLAELPKDRKKWIEKQSEKDQRRSLLYMTFERSRRGGGMRGMMNLDAADFERLNAKLSDKPKAELAKAQSVQDQRKVVAGWILTAMIEQSRFGRAARRGGSLPEADVADFVEHKLPPDQRDHVMSLPPNEAREQLRRLYWEHERGDSPFPGGPFGGRPDGKSFSPRKGPREGGDRDRGKKTAEPTTEPKEKE